MKTEIALGLALGLIAIQPASAQYLGSNPAGPYIGAALGAQFVEDDDAFDYDDGGSIDVQLGYRANDNLRFELEAGALGADIENSFDDDTLVIGRATVGIYYDFQNSDNLVVPYIGAGIGVAGVAIDEDDVDDEDLESEFTWHADAGIALNFNPHIALVPSYRYTWVDNSADVTESSVNSHAVRVGLRLSF